MPTYYAHMRGLNRAGAGARAPGPARPVTAEQVTDAILSGQWVIDVRDRVRFAEGHLAGTVSLEHSDQFATYVGWLVPWQDDIVLLADDPDRPRRGGARPGGDRHRGRRHPRPADDPELPATYRRARWEDLRALARPPVVLDVRRVDEFDDGHLRGRGQHPAPRARPAAGSTSRPARCGSTAAPASGPVPPPASSSARGRAVVHLDDEWTRVPEVPLPVSGALAA